MKTVLAFFCRQYQLFIYKVVLSVLHLSRRFLYSVAHDLVWSDCFSCSCVAFSGDYWICTCTADDQELCKMVIDNMWILRKMYRPRLIQLSQTIMRSRSNAKWFKWMLKKIKRKIFSSFWARVVLNKPNRYTVQTNINKNSACISVGDTNCSCIRLSYQFRTWVSWRHLYNGNIVGLLHVLCLGYSHIAQSKDNICLSFWHPYGKFSRSVEKQYLMN